jgi:hypothetical protein
MVMKFPNPLVFKKTKDDDYEIPMKIPYIEKMQDIDKSPLKKIKFRQQSEITSPCGILHSSFIRALRTPRQKYEAL